MNFTNQSRAVFIGTCLLASGCGGGGDSADGVDPVPSPAPVSDPVPNPSVPAPATVEVSPTYPTVTFRCHVGYLSEHGNYGYETTKVENRIVTTQPMYGVGPEYGANYNGPYETETVAEGVRFLQQSSDLSTSITVDPTNQRIIGTASSGSKVATIKDCGHRVQVGAGFSSGSKITSLSAYLPPNFRAEAKMQCYEEAANMSADVTLTAQALSIVDERGGAIVLPMANEADLPMTALGGYLYDEFIYRYRDGVT